MNRFSRAIAGAVLLAGCGGGGGADSITPTQPAPVAVAAVTVTLGVSQITAIGSTTATAELRSAAGAVLTGRSVSWTSSASNIATVDGGGNVTGVAPGTVSISASSEGRSGSASLTVTAAPVATVSVTLSQATVVVGTASTATANLLDARGQPITGRVVNWNSSATAVATINANGVITTLSAGTTIITATSEGSIGTAALIVVPPPVATVSVTLGQSLLNLGGSTTASAVMRDASGAVLTGRTVTWSSSNTNVALVNGAGNVTTVAPGLVTITGTSEGKSGTAALTVQLIPVATITVLGPGTLVPSAVGSYTATLRDANGVVLINRSITWTTSNIDAAIVSFTGNVTAMAPGTALITASSEGKFGSVQLSVRFPIASVTISGAARVKVGDSYTYSAVARLADGSVINRPMSWSIVEQSRATIDQAGYMTAFVLGAFTIRVTIDGEAWTANYSAYDWDAYTSSGTLFAVLKADNTITNRSGTSDYSELIVSCGTTGYFFVWVRTPHVITSSGSVSMSYDGGSAFSQTWTELSPSYNTLWKPGSNATVKSFALQLASLRLYGFAFTEFLGSAKAMFFRVGGLTPLLTPLFTACPSSAIVANSDAVDADFTVQRLAFEAYESNRHSSSVSAEGAVTSAALERGRTGATVGRDNLAAAVQSAAALAPATQLAKKVPR